ncbi:hypothetical protein O9992_08770 [Vibrio lentus]|nr:hypothetical protein [Vibrio lentus]
MKTVRPEVDCGSVKRATLFDLKRLSLCYDAALAGDGFVGLLLPKLRTIVVCLSL